MLTLLAFLLFPIPSSAGDLRDAALREVDSAQNLFQAIYAPAEFKHALFGWNLAAEADRARAAIRSADDGDLRAYQRAIQGLFKSARDYHVRIVFQETELSTLPFRVRRAEGRYLVTEIDFAKFPDGKAPFAVGDELLTFGGAPVDSAVQAVKGELPLSSRDATDQALAELALTSRTTAKLMTIPQGDVEVTAVRGATGDRFSFRLPWAHRVSAHSPLLLDTVLPGVRHDTPFPLDDSGALSPSLGSRNGPLPNLGTIVWSAPDSALFRAYEFTLRDRRIGYVRVPDFNGDLAHVNELATLVARMETETDALVIDQLNNPGGQSYYLDAVASLLTPAPLPTALFRNSIDTTLLAEAVSQRDKICSAHTDEELRHALGAPDIYGYPVNLVMGDGVARYDQFLVDEWNAGRRLSQPHYRRVETITPREGTAHYSKPILLLANELDFSCADMFPALLQDRGRVKVFGANTAGAGGNNDDLDAFPNLLGIKSFSITVSSELRPDGSYLESHGVKPDYPYALTARDLRENYAGYVTAVGEALGEMLR